LNSIKDAELSLENARISLQELFKSPDQSKILQARNNITQSTESLAVSEKELVNLKVSQENARTKASQDTENARKDLETARANLEILVREKDQNLGNTVSTKNTTIRNVEDSFRTYLIEMDRINTDADYILGVTDQNARKNDDFEIYLSARNPQFRNEASTLLIQSILNINALRDVVANYDFSGDRSTIIDILEQFLAGYEGIFQMTDALYRVAENSIESV
jgi:hypothetical protein